MQEKRIAEGKGLHKKQQSLSYSDYHAQALSKSERDLEKFYNTVNSIVSATASTRGNRNQTTSFNETHRNQHDQVKNIIGMAL
mmetsp:Transcript_17353/g.29180  ORF Transcript_17353/g.29180 Transcript_17353/m.29180 type:complete len:83 (-) Transcript_17353:867-1115(-)